MCYFIPSIKCLHIISVHLPIDQVLSKLLVIPNIAQMLSLLLYYIVSNYWQDESLHMLSPVVSCFLKVLLHCWLTPEQKPWQWDFQQKCMAMCKGQGHYWTCYNLSNIPVLQHRMNWPKMSVVLRSRTPVFLMCVFLEDRNPNYPVSPQDPAQVLSRAILHCAPVSGKQTCERMNSHLPKISVHIPLLASGILSDP